MVQTRTSSSIQEVVALRVAVARIYRQLRSHVASELTQSQLSALARIEQYGPLRLGELAELEGVAAATMSRVVDGLSLARLVNRSPDATDGRASAITSSVAGDMVLRRARSETTGALSAAMRTMDKADREAIRRAIPALERLGDVLSVA